MRTRCSAPVEGLLIGRAVDSSPPGITMRAFLRSVFASNSMRLTSGGWSPPSERPLGQYDPALVLGQADERNALHVQRIYNREEGAK